jgi:hypothetical protein
LLNAIICCLQLNTCGVLGLIRHKWIISHRCSWMAVYVFCCNADTTTRIAPQQHIVGNDNDMCIYRRPQPPSPLQKSFRTSSPRLSLIIAPDPSPKKTPDPQISQVLLNPNSRRHKSSNPPSLLVRRSVDDLTPGVAAAS